MFLIALHRATQQARRKNARRVQALAWLACWSLPSCLTHYPVFTVYILQFQSVKRLIFALKDAQGMQAITWVARNPCKIRYRDRKYKDFASRGSPVRTRLAPQTTLGIIPILRVFAFLFEGFSQSAMALSIEKGVVLLRTTPRGFRPTAWSLSLRLHGTVHENPSPCGDIARTRRTTPSSRVEGTGR